MPFLNLPHYITSCGGENETFRKEAGTWEWDVWDAWDAWDE
jgi:hypothetical protein